MRAAHDNQAYRMGHDRTGNRHQAFFAIGCSKCPAELKLHMAPNMPPVAVIQKFRNHNWAFAERNALGHLCPQCQKTPRKPTADKGDTAMKQPILAGSTAIAANQPIEGFRLPSMSQCREIFSLLECNFLPEKGCYINSYSDDKIATELKLPRTMVTHVREESGLKLKIDPEILALQTEAAALREMITAFDAKLEQLRARALKSAH